MTYKILNTSVNGETITTTVEYDFDGAILTIDVAHFMPQSQQDIKTGIINRAITEKKRLDAEILNKSLINSLVIGQEIPIQ